MSCSPFWNHVVAGDPELALFLLLSHYPFSICTLDKSLSGRGKNFPAHAWQLLCTVHVTRSTGVLGFTLVFF